MTIITFPNICLISLMISKIPSKISCGVQSVLLVPTKRTTALMRAWKSNSPFLIRHKTFSTLELNIAGHCCYFFEISWFLPIAADSEINTMQRADFFRPQRTELQLLNYTIADQHHLWFASFGLLDEPVVLKKKRRNLSENFLLYFQHFKIVRKKNVYTFFLLCININNNKKKHFNIFMIKHLAQTLSTD